MSFSTPGGGSAMPMFLVDLTQGAQPWMRILNGATPVASTDNALVVAMSPNSAPMVMTPSGPLTLDTTTPLNVVTAQAPTPATYSVAGTVAPAASPTDVLTLSGSASKVIRITAIGVSITSTLGVGTALQLLKRSTANSGGTSTALTAVAHDSSNAAATGSALVFTANPTLGTLAGALRSDKYAALAVASATPTYSQEWGYRPAQPIVLRGTAESLCLNLGGTTIVGGSMSFWIEFTES